MAVRATSTQKRNGAVVQYKNALRKIDLSVSFDEEINNALNDIEKTLPLNPPSKNPVIAPVNPVAIDNIIDNRIDEEFLDFIQDPGLHYSNPPNSPVGIPKKCLAYSPPKSKQRPHKRAKESLQKTKKVCIKYENNVGYQQIFIN